jgi:hypothetical protein
MSNNTRKVKMNSDKQKDYQRFSVDLPTQLHWEIKKRSLDRNITMGQWVQMAINERIREEKKYEDE